MQSSTTERSARTEWNYNPELPIGNNPLFEWPLRLRNIARYYRDYWLTLSEVSIFLMLAIVGYGLHQQHLFANAQFTVGDAGQIYLRNLGLTLLVAGGFHLLLFRQKSQGTTQKYVAQFGHKGGARFTLGNQLYDNMFWSLVSGVGVWSLYEVALLWRLASDTDQILRFVDNPALFIAILFGTGIWIAFHFYWVHRLLHEGVFYKYVHSLHHRNVNIGPWSGISMHPVEHCLYFSSMLIHLVIPSHPMHILFHGYMLALSAIFGHTGFHALVVKNKDRLALGHFHHQLHHRYFECNYGSVDFPLDVWFGTFHDGTSAARRRLKSRLGPR